MRTFSLSFLMLAVLFLFQKNAAAQDYQHLMYDPEVNFYEVVQQAESHFEKEGTGEGSGHKGFQRWKFQNEPNYYPSGNRSETNMYFAAHAFENFKKNNAGTVAGGNPWRDLGPYNLGEIAGGYSPGLGRVESFYVNPNDTNLMYLGSRSGGFWKTTDGGQNWQKSTTDTLFASGVNTLAVSISNPDSILINLRNARNGTSHGIHRSTDGGQTWTLTNFAPTALGWGGLGSSEQVYEIRYHPTIPHRVYVGTSRGLYVSHDDLQTFSQKLPAAYVTDIEFHPTDTSVVYIYDDYFFSPDENRIKYSNDGGQTFTNSAALAGNSGREVKISTSPDCPDCLFAASDNGVWKSTTKGGTFQFMTNPPRSCDGFVVSDLDTSEMIYGMLDIYKSDDGGKTFGQVTYWSLGGAGSVDGGLYVHADLREAKCMNGTYYVATDGFLCKSTDGGVSWKILSKGTGIRENYDVGVSQSNHYLSLCGSQDNGTSLKRKNGWLEYFGADGMENIIQPLNPKLMMGSYQYGGRIRSVNGGMSISSEKFHNSAAWEAPLLLDPLNQLTMYSFGENIYRTNDFGENWQILSSSGFFGRIDRAAFAENDSMTMAITDGRILRISTDGGQNFVNKYAGLPNSFITDVAFAPNDDHVLVATFASYQNNGQKVYLSQDQGATWQNITGNLGDMPLRSVIIDHQKNPMIYVGAEIGVFAKPLNGGAWQLFNKSLPNCTMSDLEIMRGSNTLRGASWGRGLWETDLVNRENFPKIITTEIGDAPSVYGPRAEIAQPIQSKIFYNGNLSDVFVKWSADDIGLDSVIPMQFVTDSLWETVRPLPPQTLGTKMYFKVLAVGSAGDTSETYRFMYRTQTKDYCPAAASPNTGADWIAEVKLADLQHTSVKNGYADFTQHFAQLSHSQNYTMEVQLNFSFDDDTVFAWIDYDNNFNFDDDELIRFAAIDANHKATANFTTPFLVGSDTLRMRVRSAFRAAAAQSCGTLAGETEDYSIAMTGSPIGLRETSENQSVLQIYPNPTDGKITVERPENWSKTQLTLRDLNGKILQRFDLKDVKKHELDLGSFASGMYILQWKSSENQGNVKISLR